MSKRRTVRDALVPRSFVSDLTVSSPRLGQRLALAMSAHNLFDTAYFDPGLEEHRQQLILQDGRTLLVRATWHLR